MTSKITPKSRKQNLVEQEVDGELLIYDLERDRAFCLNQTSAFVWQACDGKRTIAEINDLVGERLKTQTDEDIVWLALDQLSKEKLIDPAVDVGDKFAGLSRRQVIKKIGLGSMVALPVVASLVAPSAAFAQTTMCGGTLGMVCSCFVGATPACVVGNPAPAGTCGGFPDCSPGATPAACVCSGPFTWTACNPVFATKGGMCF